MLEGDFSGEISRLLHRRGAQRLLRSSSEDETRAETSNQKFSRSRGNGRTRAGDGRGEMARCYRRGGGFEELAAEGYL